MIRPAPTAAAILVASTASTFAVLAAPAGAASAGTTHTLHVTAKAAADVRYKNGDFNEADKIHNAAGKALGTDISDCTPVSSTKANCTGVVGLVGGLLDARFSINLANGAISGTITGGTMNYRHTTGTVTGTAFNGGSHLTITYHS